MASSSSHLKLQHQIRQNAMQTQDFFSDLQQWEKSIKKKDKALRRSKGQGSKRPVRSGASVSMQLTPGPLQDNPTNKGSTVKKRKKSKKKVKAKRREPAATGAAHTYDKGYKKWENFDVDAALAAVDQDEQAGASSSSSSSEDEGIPAPRRATKRVAVPSTRTVNPGKSREELEREDGNKYFKRGEFREAIKSYTRCLALNPRNATAYSNRAMAFLRLQEYGKADEDCCSALKYDAGHLKSLLRRAAARNGLGRHRAALLDFEQVTRVQPSNKQARQGVRKTRELVRSAIRKTPRRQLSIEHAHSPHASQMPGHVHIPIATAPAAPSPAAAAAAPGAGPSGISGGGEEGAFDSSFGPQLPAAAAGGGGGGGSSGGEGHGIRIPILSPEGIDTAASSGSGSGGSGGGGSGNGVGITVQSSSRSIPIVEVDSGEAEAEAEGEAEAEAAAEAEGEAEAGDTGVGQADSAPVTDGAAMAVDGEPLGRGEGAASAALASPPVPDTAAATTPPPAPLPNTAATPAAATTAAAAATVTAAATTAAAATTTPAAATATAAAATATAAAGPTSGSSSCSSARRQFTVPTTGYEFERQWKAIEGESSLCWQYLQLVPPKSLPRLLATCLDGDLLKHIVAALSAHAFPDGVAQCMKVLSALSRVSRFSMTLMFLSAADKQAVLALLHKLTPECAGYPKRQRLLAVLRTKYGAST